MHRVLKCRKKWRRVKHLMRREDRGVERHLRRRVQKGNSVSGEQNREYILCSNLSWWHLTHCMLIKKSFPELLFSPFVNKETDFEKFKSLHRQSIPQKWGLVLCEILLNFFPLYLGSLLKLKAAVPLVMETMNFFLARKLAVIL